MSDHRSDHNHPGDSEGDGGDGGWGGSAGRRPVSQFYEVVYCPLEGSAHVYRGKQGERGGGMFTREARVPGRSAAEAMAVGFGFYRAGEWEWRYDAFWVAEVRRIMARPPVPFGPPTIPDH